MFKRIIFLLSLGFVGACAIVSSPTGGEKDELAPQVTFTSPENKSTQFSSNTVVIEFDEYVELNNFTSQFYSSPPLTGRVEPKLKGKRLTITLEEDLLPNTTYTWSFGNSIQDITEGNVQGDFKYVFSTGDQLDSLKITGTVVDAFTGTPQEGLIAVLYPIGIEDSVLIKQRPLYYTITNKEGWFSLENLALDTFQLFAIKDENLNLSYDQGAEQYGFLSEPISSANSTRQTIRVFSDRREMALKETKQVGYGKILLAFTQPVDSLEINVSGNDWTETEGIDYFLERDENSDTIFYWYNPEKLPENLDFLFLDLKANTLVEDSIRILIQDFKIPKANLTLKTKSIAPEDYITLSCPAPITSFNQDSIIVMSGETPMDAEFTQSMARELQISFSKKYGQEFKVVVYPGAVKTAFGINNDSTEIPIKIENEEDLAILKVALTAVDDEQKIFQLFTTSKNQIVSEELFTTSLNLNLKDLQPGSYGFRVIWDENKNGIWDVGEFRTRKQPEVVMYYPNSIDLRANWELESVWEIPPLENQ